MLRATLWLADMADYDEMNIVWDTWVAGIDPPARPTCGVGPAAPIYKIEIVVMAARE